MSQNFNNKNDSMDVNELNSLNNDISENNIEQLQQQLMSNMSSDADIDDEYLFEEVDSDDDENDKLIKDTSFDDPFARKYALKQKQAKLQAKNQDDDNKDTENKETDTISNDNVNNDSNNNVLTSVIQEQTADTVQQNIAEQSLSAETQNVKKINATETDTNGQANSTANPEQANTNKQQKEGLAFGLDSNTIDKFKARFLKSKNKTPKELEIEEKIRQKKKLENSIEHLSKGKITERILSDEQKNYHESLDYLDENTKYEKYVIYISPENIKYIESISTKERKYLINTILKEQDEYSRLKHKFKMLQLIIKHIIITIITIAIATPCLYALINVSLETTINNNNRAKVMFQTMNKKF